MDEMLKWLVTILTLMKMKAVKMKASGLDALSLSDASWKVESYLMLPLSMLPENTAASERNGRG